MTVRDQLVIVTGSGGSGSGRSIALRFALEGARVIVSDVNDEGGGETLRLIESSGGRAKYFHADVCKDDDLRSLFEFAEREFGSLAVLVNNASATNLYQPNKPLEFWDELIATDLLAPMRATRLAIEAMHRSGKGGAIVNISSTSALEHGRSRPGGSPAYDVAKAGVLRLTTMLAALASEKIRVNCLAPDWIAIPEIKAYHESLTPEQRKQDGVPSRLTSLEEIADAVFMLATDERLAGRVMVWWSDDEPRLIPFGDPGYADLV